MKNKLILVPLMALCLFLRGYSQNDQTVSSGRFHVGISYSYLSYGLDLSSLQFRSEWQGVDWGTYSLSQEEIDTINTYAKRDRTINAVTANIGMSFIKNPESKWQVSGTLLLGIASSETNVHNDLSGQDEYNIKSGFSKPCLGLGVNLSYKIKGPWSVSLRPLFVTTFGTATDIVDGLAGDPENMTRSIEDQFFTHYERAGLLANFTIGNVMISAGPGFYYIHSNHTYTIEYTNQLNGEIMLNERKSTSVSNSFIDGNVRIDWNIIKPLAFYIDGGVGGDLFISTGLNYAF